MHVIFEVRCKSPRRVIGCMAGLITELETSPVPSESELRPPVLRSEASAVHLDILPMVAGADDDDQEPASGGGDEAVAIQLSVVPEGVSCIALCICRQAT